MIPFDFTYWGFNPDNGGPREQVIEAKREQLKKTGVSPVVYLAAGMAAAVGFYLIKKI